jgi:hypothetical protein
MLLRVAELADRFSVPSTQRAIRGDWRRVALRRSENGRRQNENQSLDQREAYSRAEPPEDLPQYLATTGALPQPIL